MCDLKVLGLTHLGYSNGEKQKMKCVVRILVLVFIGIVFLPLLPAIGRNAAAWSGKRFDGTEISKNELNRVLEEHKSWIDKTWEEPDQKEGNKLQLQGADLIGVQLNGIDLREADLNGANLTDAKLIGADLRQADLRNVNLTSAVLRAANLREADLRGADLIDADLSGAKIQGLRLEKANLSDTQIDDSFAKLQKWKVVWQLMNMEVSGKDLSGHDLSEAYMRSVNLSGADLSQADLRAADLNGAILSNTDLRKADLRDAGLIGADLRDADLTKAVMSNANLTEAKLGGVIFEPKAGSLPDIAAISSAEDLSKLRYEDSPHALVELREAFKKAGLLTQERKITYAIKHAGRKALWKRGVWGKLESLFNLIFFERTCLYGMKPGRPLILMLMLICFLTIPYTIALMWPPKKDGIWQIWFSDRVRKHLGSDEPIRLRLGFLRALKFGLFFSILSAFSIGWREINVRTWIVRLQRQEYILRATGWVRTVSGVQSLMSVYLMTLWILTYFGRLFETV
jgi:uncharacterized protein YjbI with pentapeptide repeats